MLNLDDPVVSLIPRYVVLQATEGRSAVNHTELDAQLTKLENDVSEETRQKVQVLLCKAILYGTDKLELPTHVYQVRLPGVRNVSHYQ